MSLEGIPGAPATDRLSFWQAAWVIARRDFLAILGSRTFFFFLLGPLFPIVVGGLAGGIGSQVRESVDRPELGIALSAEETEQMIGAHRKLRPQMGGSLPEITVVATLEPDTPFSPLRALRESDRNLGAIATGSLDELELYGSEGLVNNWRGRVALLAREAKGGNDTPFPAVGIVATSSTNSDQNRNRLLTAQGGQLLLFLLTMLLAGMVLSNLVEEKANKIIEILAAAIPMDAVFFGKLFAMLGVSFVGISVWGTVGGSILLGTGQSLDALPGPAVGWPAFFALGIVYFAMAYLLLGSIFLAIGSLATTVREVQTLSMPVTMLQLIVFFFASYTLAQMGSTLELLAVAIPFSSPFAMLARAAQAPELWPHLIAVAWQAMWVAIFIRIGASMFRKRVMKSGGSGANKRRWWQGRKVAKQN